MRDAAGAKKIMRDIDRAGEAKFIEMIAMSVELRVRGLVAAFRGSLVFT